MAWPVTEDTKNPPHWPLTPDVARYAGDGVAVVVAQTRALAKDAAELVEVDYEPLPAVTDVMAALEDGAPVVHEELGSNHCFTWPLQAGEPDRLFAEAAVTVKERYRQQRLIPNAIEPRGVLVQPIPAQGEFTMWSATQIPHILRVTLAGVSGIPEAKLRVIAPGRRRRLRLEARRLRRGGALLVLAKKLGLPIKWIEERIRGLPRDDPRARRRPGDRARGDRRRQGDGGARSRLGEHGRVPPARDARDPAPRRVAVRRLPTTSRATTSSSTARSRTRRRPTRTAAPGGPRRRTSIERAMDALARKLDTRPGRAPAAELHARTSRRRWRRG